MGESIYLSLSRTVVVIAMMWSASPRAKPQTAATTIRPSEPAFRLIEISPRIEALKQQFSSHGSRALDEFWREVERTGTPLVEPAQGNPDQVIVTFIWRGDPRTQNVGLLAPLQNSHGMPTFPLKRLLNTDVWYRSWQMRDDLRFTYRFLPNVKPDDKYLQREGTVDPFNAQNIKVSYDEGETTTEFSIAAMPHALDESWIVKQRNIPAGKMDRYQLKNQILGNERRIWVYTPPGYNEDRQRGYPLLVLFDGFFYASSISAPTILDNLIQAGKVPPMVAALVDNPRESRGSELGYDPPFVEFLTKEVLPWIHEHWNVTYDSQKCIVGGLSMGGSEAAFVAMRHPEAFGNVLSQSGAFADGNGKDVKWEWLAGQYEASRKLPIRFYIEVGLLEDVSREGPTGVTANRHFVEVLKNKGYAVTYEEVGGSHEPVHWRAALPYALMSLAR